MAGAFLYAKFFTLTRVHERVSLQRHELEDLMFKLLSLPLLFLLVGFAAPAHADTTTYGPVTLGDNSPFGETSYYPPVQPCRCDLSRRRAQQ